MMFPSTAAARSNSSTGMFGYPSALGFATGMASYGGTSTSTFCNTSPSSFTTSFSGFASSTAAGFSPSLPSSNLVNGPNTTGLTFKCDQSHLRGQERGSRIAAYKTTADAESCPQKLVAISAMPAYKAKSHEELRWEDYNFPGKGGLGLSSSAVKSTSTTPYFFTASQGTTSMSSKSVKPNLFARTFPSVDTSSYIGMPTWKYPGPTFTSQPLQFSPSATTCLTTTTSATSNSFNPFIPGTNLAHNPFINPSTSPATDPSSPSPSFAAFTGVVDNTPSSLKWPTPIEGPFLSTVMEATNPFSCNTLVPPASTTVRAAPFSPFPPGTGFTSPSSTASSVSVAPLNHNSFINPSTSPATHTSSSSPTFSAFTGVLDSTPSSLKWSTPIVTEAANSSSVSLVSSGLSSTFNQPTTLFNFNPWVPSTQNCNGTTAGIIGQSSISQLSSSQVTNMEKVSPGVSPFGTLPPKPHMFVDGSQSKQPIQYGISRIPVKDKPAPVKYSMLTTRHLSGRIKLPVRKYDPKSNAPKMPYFSDTKEIPVAAYVPRDNPRALVLGPERWPENAMRDNIHEEKLPGSTYENERDGPTKEKLVFTTILDVPAKLQQPDYYTQPQISQLEAKERAEPGYCRRVKDFVVGRHGYGSIKFLGETDLSKLDIETVVQFNNREVILYMDGSKKPPVGEGLNKPAEITLLNIKYFDKKTGMQHTDGSKIDKYIEMLKKKAVVQGAEFMSYDPVEGEWKFRVQHF